MRSLDFVDAFGSSCLHAICHHLMRCMLGGSVDATGCVRLARNVLFMHMPVFVEAFLSRNLHGYLPYELLELFGPQPAENPAHLAAAQELGGTSGLTQGTAESAGSSQGSGEKDGATKPKTGNAGSTQGREGFPTRIDAAFWRFREDIRLLTANLVMLVNMAACDTRGVRRTDPDAYNRNGPGAGYTRIGQGRGFSIVAVPPGCEADSPEDEDIFDSAGTSSIPPISRARGHPKKGKNKKTRSDKGKGGPSEKNKRGPSEKNKGGPSQSNMPKRVKKKVLKQQPKKESSILSELRTVPPEAAPCPYPVDPSYPDGEQIQRKGSKPQSRRRMLAGNSSRVSKELCVMYAGRGHAGRAVHARANNEGRSLGGRKGRAVTGSSFGTTSVSTANAAITLSTISSVATANQQATPSNADIANNQSTPSNASISKAQATPASGDVANNQAALSTADTGIHQGGSEGVQNPAVSSTGAANIEPECNRRNESQQHE